MLAIVAAVALFAGCRTHHVETLEETFAGPPAEIEAAAEPEEVPALQVPPPAGEAPDGGPAPAKELPEAPASATVAAAPLATPSPVSATTPERVKVIVPEYEITPPEKVFNPGERLEFSVRWYFVKAGRAYMNVKSLAPYEGKLCYHLLSRATSNLLFFFKVNDWAETYTTADKLLPVRFEKHLREGRYKKDLIAHFFHDMGIAIWDAQAGFIDPNCRDILSCFYYFRTMPLPPVGETVMVG